MARLLLEKLLTLSSWLYTKQINQVFHIDDTQEISDKFLNLPPDLDDILTEDNPHGVDDEADDDWL